MNFKKATDSLFATISHEEFAKLLGVSVASVRQARLGLEAKAHRLPPAGWECAVARAAKDRVADLQRLIHGLDSGHRLKVG